MKLKKLAKIFAIIFLLTFSFNALVTAPALAQLQDKPWESNLDTVVEGTYDTSQKNIGLIKMIGNIIKIVLGFLGIILLILMIYAGFLWMTSAGDEEKVGKAKKLISSAVIGILIVVLAYALTYFIIDKLTTGITTTGTITE